jgi:hypothetical protein
MREDETKVRHLTGRKLSDSTIVQRVVACRLSLLKNPYKDELDPLTNTFHVRSDFREQTQFDRAFSLFRQAGTMSDISVCFRLSPYAWVWLFSCKVLE